MENLFGLFTLTLPIWEIVLRGSAIYLSLILLFRFVVRRDIGAVGTADLLILVLISDASQNAMAGESKTIADGLVLIATLIGWNLLLNWLSFRFPRLRRLVEADKLLLIRNGEIQRRNMRREFITEEELLAKLRSHGLEKCGDVRRAYLESDGEISVIPKGPEPQAGEAAAVRKKT
jgi:uncharacterized membrane protein YcaP (DUF421 family)